MNQMENYFKNYFLTIKKSLDSIDVDKLEKIINLITRVSKSKGKVIIFGNGGSAAIASHLTVDFINAAKIKAMSFNDSSIITCFSNDYGYENWVDKALECYAEDGDLAILISSSGQSNNMINGAKKAKYMGLNVITLTGFLPNNPLRKLGDVNLWTDSNAYNIVEMTHNVWLLSVVDYIIENVSDT
jgi:D-sedoheptulose 7-phosphate isomerase